MFWLTNPLVRGVISSTIVLGVLGLTTGLLVYFTNIPESASYPISLFILAFSVFMGSFLASRRKKSQGLIMGLEIAVIFIFLLVVISIVFLPGQFSWQASLVKFGLISVSSVIGGILGVAFIRTNE